VNIVALTEPALDRLIVTITEEVFVRAPLDATFEALLQQMGPENATPEGTPLPMTLEAWPGGRWFRDLGNGNGHLWGLVQAIKRPTLVEITGPLFMSSPVVNNLQYRLKEVPDGTMMSFRHSGFGIVPDQPGRMDEGWRALHERVRRQAESGGRTH
jgi:Activator of Hsp90 ATPase homolog 1-like protein